MLTASRALSYHSSRGELEHDVRRRPCDFRAKFLDMASSDFTVAAQALQVLLAQHTSYNRYLRVQQQQLSTYPSVETFDIFGVQNTEDR